MKSCGRLSTDVALPLAPHYNPTGTIPLRVENAVSTLPLSLKKEGLVERHQLEGNDPSDRYFSRAIMVNRTANGYLARVTYEALTVEGQTHTSIPVAVNSLVEKLLELGFRRLRTRPNFKGRRYLAEKETWIDYPDPR